MKTDIKLCASSFTMMSLPALFRLVTVIFQSHACDFNYQNSVPFCFSWGRKWIAFWSWQSWNPTAVFGTSL